MNKMEDNKKKKKCKQKNSVQMKERQADGLEKQKWGRKTSFQTKKKICFQLKKTKVNKLF